MAVMGLGLLPPNLENGELTDLIRVRKPARHYGYPRTTDHVTPVMGQARTATHARKAAPR